MSLKFEPASEPLHISWVDAHLHDSKKEHVNQSGPESGPGYVHFQIDRLGGEPREQKMLKGHLPRFIYHQVY